MTAAAEGGKATAMNNLALLYERGEGVEQSYEESDKWAVKAAQGGDARQIIRHSLFYADGDGIFPQSNEKALEFLKIGAEAGDAESEYLLARFYIEGKIVEKDFETAVSHLGAAGKKGYKQALNIFMPVALHAYGPDAAQKYYEVVKYGADDGYYECMVRAFKCLFNGDGVEKNEELALKYLTSAADDNYKEALFLMGVLNMNGMAVENPSPEKALEYFNIVLEKGEYDSITAAAHRNIGLMYQSGNGVPQDYDKAIAHLEEAADHGDTDALLKAALAHDEGGWATPDFPKAVSYYQKLHDTGNLIGTTCLGHMYEKGLGVEQDCPKAVALYTQAADQGDTRGMISLAIALQEGIGVDKDEKKAFELLQKASDAGDSNGTMLLGYTYLNGQGVEKDIKHAVELWEQGAAQGNEKAQDLVRKVYLDEDLAEYVDPQKAIQFLLPYANAGDPDAMYHLAENLSKVNSWDSAHDWYVKAAEAGSTEAQYSLGFHAYILDELDDDTLRWLATAAEDKHVGAMNCMADILMSGTASVAQDQRRAFQYYETAANLGNLYALYQAGRCHIFGKGTPVNESRGFLLIKRAADSGSYDALDTLGDRYRDGTGIAKNIPKAIKCYQNGLEKGHTEWCQYGLGSIYSDVKGGYFDQRLAEQYLIPLTERQSTKEGAAFRLGLMYSNINDSANALRWFKIAADEGNAGAQYNIGVYYFNGEGGARDLDQAEFYFSLAARNGHPSAASDAEDCRRLKRQQASQYQSSPSQPSTSQSSSTQSSSQSSGGGCYIATAVYGSYDCTEVWTLRRFRDYTLAETWYGLLFIRLYYAISPTIVRWFGHTEWFNHIWKNRLDKMVNNLQRRGVDSTSYEDRSIF